jgi:hypothetical protein
MFSVAVFFCSGAAAPTCFFVFFLSFPAGVLGFRCNLFPIFLNNKQSSYHFFKVLLLVKLPSMFVGVLMAMLCWRASGGVSCWRGVVAIF